MKKKQRNDRIRDVLENKNKKTVSYGVNMPFTSTLKKNECHSKRVKEIAANRNNYYFTFFIQTCKRMIFWAKQYKRMYRDTVRRGHINKYKFQKMCFIFFLC